MGSAPEIAEARSRFIDDSESDVLSHLDFPEQHRTEAAQHESSGAAEQGSEATCRRRRDLPDEASIMRLIGAVLLERNDEWQLQHRYMQVEAMAEPAAPGNKARPGSRGMTHRIARSCHGVSRKTVCATTAPMPAARP